MQVDGSDYMAIMSLYMSLPQRQNCLHIFARVVNITSFDVSLFEIK